MTSKNDLIDVATAVKLTGVSKHSIYLKIKTGELEGCTKISNRWYLTSGNLTVLSNIKPKSGMVRIKEVAETTGMSQPRIERMIKNQELCGAWRAGDQKQWYLTAEDVLLIKNKMKLPDNMHTIKEVSKLTGLSIGAITRKIRSGELKNIVTVGRINYLSNDDIEILKDELKLIENCYTLTEAQQLLNMSDEKVRIFFDENECFRMGHYLYVKKEVVDNYLNNYCSVDYLVNSVGIDEQLILQGIKLNEVSYYELTKKNFLIHKIGIEILREKQLIFNASYKKDDLRKILNCSQQKLNQILEYLEQDIQAINIFDIKCYSISEVETLIGNAGSTDKLLSKYTSMYTRDKNKGISKIEDSKIIELNGNSYINITAVPNVYGFSIKNIQTAHKKGKIIDIISTEEQKRYVSVNELDNIVEIIENSMSYLDIQTILQSHFGDTVYKTQNAYTKFLNKEDIFSFDYIGYPHYRVKYEDRNKLINHLLRQATEEREIKDTLNPYERYDKLVEIHISDFDKLKYKRTLELYTEYVYMQIGETRTKKILNLVHNKFNTLNYIVSQVSQDIHKLTDEQLKELFGSIDLILDKKNLTGYIDFLKSKYPEICCFKDRYKRYKPSKEYKVSDVYTLKEWKEYSTYLTDVDQHIKKAFNDRVYARYWLFSLLHFSICWRSDDIVSMPPLSMIEVEKYSIEWFMSNEFTLTEGQQILNSIKKYFDNDRANKNEVLKHFIVSLPYVIPTAIAFIILEKHRKENKKDTLFGVEKVESFKLIKVMGSKLNGFSSLKANRTLLTLINKIASETEGYSNIAYTAGTYLRSHKVNIYQKSETTSYYIYPENQEGNLLDISKHLFQRGIFGWLYKTVIGIAYGCEDNKTISETTDIIEINKLNIAPEALENVSKYIEEEGKFRAELINELLNTSKEQLVEVIDKLINRNLCSKQNDIYCLKYKKCPFIHRESCSGCRYSIPTNYSLLTVSNELICILDKLNDIDETNYVERERYSYQALRLLMVIKEAKNQFDFADQEYIKAFINLDEIEKKLNLVKETKFLLVSR